MQEKRLSDLISAATTLPFKVDTITPIPGGSAWQTLSIDNARTGTPSRIFAKVGEPEHMRIFAAEQDGLQRLHAASDSLHIPAVIARETIGEQAVLLLEWIDLHPLTPTSAAAMGEGFVALHRTTGEKFGLEVDNFIGATPQANKPDADWVTFWQHQRLVPQLQLAAKHRYPSKMISRGERLAADCAAFFSNYRPAASLLHGDLWSGNVAADEDGRPVVFDPAVYYGDREADIAMTEFFGRFPAEFYTAYNNLWRLDDGYLVRKNFYNLYHVLNHANLFSGDYVLQSEKMIERLLAEF